MKIFTEIPSAISNVQTPIAVTIGTFDGLHLGHQAIFDRMHSLTKERGTNLVITFNNNPKSILLPSRTGKDLITYQHKLHLLERFHIDFTYLLEFSKELARVPYDQFIQRIYGAFPFSHLILGERAAFGKNKEGKEAQLKMLGKQLGFQTQYLNKLCSAGLEISSNRIRSLIEKGNLTEAESLLGRPYSIYAKITPHEVKQGIAKATLSTKGMCSLPEGNYTLQICSNSITLPGTALFFPDRVEISYPYQELPESEIQFLQS